MKTKILSASVLTIVLLALIFANTAFGFVDYEYGTITATTKREGLRTSVLSLSIPVGLTPNSDLVLIVSGMELKLSAITISTLTKLLPSFESSNSGNESVVGGATDGIIFSFHFSKGSLSIIALSFDSRFQWGKSDSKKEISLGVKGRGIVRPDVDLKMLEKLFGKPTGFRRRVFVDF